MNKKTIITALLALVAMTGQGQTDTKGGILSGIETSPSIGVKVHITPNIGVLASVCDEAYLVNAFDNSRNDYRSKLIHSLGVNIGVCFQIKGW
jgi:hypothetical protein